jgi:hypothetical protein
MPEQQHIVAVARCFDKKSRGIVSPANGSVLVFEVEAIAKQPECSS